MVLARSGDHVISPLISSDARLPQMTSKNAYMYFNYFVFSFHRYYALLICNSLLQLRLCLVVTCQLQGMRFSVPENSHMHYDANSSFTLCMWWNQCNSSLGQIKTWAITGDLSLIKNDPDCWYRLSLQLTEPLWRRSDNVNHVLKNADLEIPQLSSLRIPF